MTWAFDIFSEPAQDYVQVSFVEGVTLFIPDKGVILAIETKDKHEDMTKIMADRGLLIFPGQVDADSNKQ